MKRKATAMWTGDGKTGNGKLSTQSGALNHQPYSFTTRFVSEDGKAGTNPEELIAAAHAGCFTMALSFALTNAGFIPESLQTDAEVEVLAAEGGFSITGIHLTTIATVPKITKDNFDKIANDAKANCPVSKALKAVPITLDARVRGSV